MECSQEEEPKVKILQSNVSGEFSLLVKWKAEQDLEKSHTDYCVEGVGKTIYVVTAALQ